MSWKPSNEPTHYDQARIAQTDPIETEILKLRLPLIRLRKLNGILNALIVQIEHGGDSPGVNRLLLDALREGLRHQVGARRARAALHAISAFERAEAERWEQVEAGTLPPIELTAEEQLNDLMQEGYGLLRARQHSAACDKWLQTWELIKQMATPDMRSAMAFDAAYPGMLQSVFNWCSDLEMELQNAGYHEQRLRYANEFLAQFPDEDELRHVNLRRAAGEALWALGRQAEAEAAFRSLVKDFPDNAWAYIGWSDEYLWGHAQPPDYARAEAILLQALDRPNLDEREYVLERLVRLYEEWDHPAKGAPFAAELDEIRAHKEARPRINLAQAARWFQESAAPTPKPKHPPRRRERGHKRKKRRR